MKRKSLPISDTLQRIQSMSAANGLSVGTLWRELRGQGPFLFMMILCVPFLLPVSIPGTSTPFGILIILMSLSQLRRREPRFPKKFMNMKLESKHVTTLFQYTIKLFRKLEKLSKPRMLSMTEDSTLLIVHTLTIIFSALLLMLPLPIPFTNALPAYAIFFFSVGFLQRDGYLILGGYGFAFLASAYLALLAFLGVEGVQRFLF